jgi:hypothetical protein
LKEQKAQQGKNYLLKSSVRGANERLGTNFPSISNQDSSHGNLANGPMAFEQTYYTKLKKTLERSHDKLLMSSKQSFPKVKGGNKTKGAVQLDPRVRLSTAEDGMSSVLHVCSDDRVELEIPKKKNSDNEKQGSNVKTQNSGIETKKAILSKVKNILNFRKTSARLDGQGSNVNNDRTHFLFCSLRDGDSKSHLNSPHIGLRDEWRGSGSRDKKGFSKANKNIIQPQKKQKQLNDKLKDLVVFPAPTDQKLKVLASKNLNLVSNKFRQLTINARADIDCYDRFSVGSYKSVVNDSEVMTEGQEVEGGVFSNPGLSKVFQKVKTVLASKDEEISALKSELENVKMELQTSRQLNSELIRKIAAQQL